MRVMSEGGSRVHAQRKFAQGQSAPASDGEATVEPVTAAPSGNASSNSSTASGPTTKRRSSLATANHVKNNGDAAAATKSLRKGSLSRGIILNANGENIY